MLFSIHNVIVDVIQFGVRYNHANKASGGTEVREFGCDTKGNPYHKQDPDWLKVSKQASHTAKDRFVTYVMIN